MIGSFSFFVFCFSQQTIDDMDMEVGTVLFCLLPLSEVWSFSKDLLIKSLYKKRVFTYTVYKVCLGEAQRQ